MCCSFAEQHCVLLNQDSAGGIQRVSSAVSHLQHLPPRSIATGNKWAHHSGERKIHLWPVAAKNSVLVYCYRIFPCPYTCTFLEKWISKVKTFLSSTPCSSRNITNRNISLQKTCIFMDIKEVNTIPFQVGKKGEKKKKEKCIFRRQIQTKNKIIRIFIIASMIYCTLSM